MFGHELKHCWCVLQSVCSPEEETGAPVIKQERQEPETSGGAGGTITSDPRRIRQVLLLKSAKVCLSVLTHRESSLRSRAAAHPADPSSGEHGEPVRSFRDPKHTLHTFGDGHGASERTGTPG